MKKKNKIYLCFFGVVLCYLTIPVKKYLTRIRNHVIMDNDHAMKNERCLIKKIIEINEKVIKTCIIFIGFMFLTGFYDERNIYVDLEEITLEIGQTLPEDKFDYITNHLTNDNLFLENNVPKNENGETNMVGTYSYYIVYRNEERMYSRLTNKKATISVIDTIKPEIRLKDTAFSFEYGKKINVSDIAICYDLSECNIYFENEIDTRVSGNHEITVVAIDQGDNVNKKTVNINIKEKPKPVYYSISFPWIDQHNNRINRTLSEEEIIARRYELVAFAKQFEGNPYVYGGTSLTNGADCSGFTMAVYNHFGYLLPRIATSQGYVGMPISYNQLLPGDLIVYLYGHVGIYIGNGMMIHAGTQQTGIVIVPIFEGSKVYRRIIY